MHPMHVYDMVYALAACGGREAELFGSCAPLARECFARSVADDYFPELWFELPLAGEPWFDLHALVSREDLDARGTFDHDSCGGYPEVFGWFAAQGTGARQLALSWDVGSGHVDNPAVQLLRRTHDTQLTCDFLAVTGRSDAIGAYRTFEGRLPEGWFACYTGVFPTRREPFLRVECRPPLDLQEEYAGNAGLLAAHLRQVGLDGLDDTLLSRCQTLAETPFHLEFQFDVTPAGAAGATFGASVRFAPPVSGGGGTAFDVTGEAGELMQHVESWGLADSRWRLLAGTMFAKRMTVEDDSRLLYCFPAFLKLRWRGGEPLDAKTYLMAGAQGSVSA